MLPNSTRLVGGPVSTTSRNTLCCPAPHRQLGHTATQHQRLRVKANNKFQDDLVDYVTAGPKMRKWYGQGERLPSNGGDGQREEEPAPEEDEGEGFTLVTNAETDLGEQVLLQLILARLSVKALVADSVKAKQAYGSYISPLSVDVGSGNAAQAALRRVRTLVCLGREGRLLSMAAQAGIKHVIMVSQTGSGGGPLLSMFDKEGAELRDSARVAALKAAGVNYTLLNVSGVDDTPRAGVVLGGGGGGAVSREALARVVAALLSEEEGLQADREVMVCGSMSGLTPAEAVSALQA